MQTMSRTDAAAQGLKHYYTGKPCRKGHDRQRSVANGACLGCLAQYATDYRRKFQGEVMGMSKVERDVCPEHVPALDAFIELLRLAKIGGIPVPRVPHSADVASVNTFVDMLWAGRDVAPPPAPAAFDPYPMWVRIHGQEIADQMRSMAAK